MKFRITKEKEFYRRVFLIMLPVAAQQAINMGVNMMDTIMLGNFGEVQLSASSLANSFYMLYGILCMGIIGGCSVLVSQYWGAGNLEKAREVFSLAFRLAAVLGFAFAIVTWLTPGTIMQLFTSDPEVIEAGVRYLKITAFIYMIHGTSQVVAFLMRSVRQAQLGLYVSIISFFANIFANWVFIFGKLGAPRMEIAGAALGTLIARCVEFLVTFLYVLKIDQKLKLKVSDFLHNPERSLYRKYFQVGAPALVSDGLLGLGSTAISMVLGRMGSDVVAANSICMVVDRLFTVVVQGISNASGIITGNTIGEGKPDKAQEQGETFYLLSILCGILSTILVSIGGPLTIRLYNLQPETITVTKSMMYAYAVVMFFSAVQSIMTKGVLRGGGDTKFLLKADVLFMWLVSIPLGILAGLVLHAPGWVAVICLRIDFAIKSIWCVSRLKSGKWIKNITVET
ncbi:MAG: MATE family efflux transporter [Lachnospiraceae bacterium]|jgi:putative MATE family efflux protein|nr:MATE family efflux transporter [Lachnospiraceae bacterium]